MNNEEIKALLRDILKWQRLQGIQVALELLPKVLDTEEKKIVYEMADGKNGIKEIKSKINIATGTIHRWWNNWLVQGIITKEGSKYKKIISLKELGTIIEEIKGNKEG